MSIIPGHRRLRQKCFKFKAVQSVSERVVVVYSMEV